MIRPDCTSEKANLSVFRRWQRFGQCSDALRIAQMDLQTLFSHADARTARAPATVGTRLKRRFAPHTHPAIGPARALAAHWCIRPRIAANTFRGTATSAIWKVTYRA